MRTAGGGVPRRKRLSVYSFRLEVIHAMRAAYLMAREQRRLKEAGDGMTEIVAQKILELAEAGETDPERLCSAVTWQHSSGRIRYPGRPACRLRAAAWTAWMISG